MDVLEAQKLTERIYIRLNNRRPEIEKLEKYFRGEQPLNYATKAWKEANAEQYAGFSDNWSAPVVNAESERIDYTGMSFASGKDAGNTLHEHWMRNEMDMQSSQGFVTTLTTGRSFVIVWGDRDGAPIVTWEHPSNVEIEYEWENPRLRRAALKTWVDERLEYATLYTKTEVWKWERPRQRDKNDRESQAEQSKTGYAADGGWQARVSPGDDTWPLSNPLGVVPVVELQNRPTLMGDPVSEIQGVMPMQDSINLLWAYLFLAADYASMDARVILGAEPPKIPILDKDGVTVIGTRPVDMKDLREKRLLNLTGSDAKIDSWKAASLDIFTDTIDIAVGHIASQTRTPPTYLVSKTGMSNVNGEGLKASEIGLNKKVLEFWTYAGPAIREVNRLIALVIGDESLAAETQLARVNHLNPEIRSEAQLADMLVKLGSVGFPFEYLMELYGIGPLDIPRILDMRKREMDEALGAGVQAAVQGALTDVDSDLGAGASEAA